MNKQDWKDIGAFCMAEGTHGVRAKRTGPSRFHAFFMRRAYECGYSDAIKDATRIVSTAKRPERPDVRTLRIELEKERSA